MTSSRLRLAARRLFVPALLVAAGTALPGCIGFGYSTKECTVGVPPDWRVATADDLLRRWGEPDERTSVEDGTELWMYDRGLRWSYVCVCVIVCVPLGVPVGRESDTFHLRDGVIESMDRVRGGSVAFLCGIIPGVCPDVGCKSVRNRL